MSLIDEAIRALYEAGAWCGVCDFESKVCDDCRYMRAGYVDVVTRALTADGPVILLADEGEGVRVATWAEVQRYSDEYRRLMLSDVLEIAGEVAE